MPITINIEGDIKRIEVIRSNCTRPVPPGPVPPENVTNVTNVTKPTCIEGSPTIINAGVTGAAVI